MSNNTINIDKLTLRLPKGWQGDPVMLARAVADHLQNHTQHLSSHQSLNLSVKGQFNGQFNQVKSQLDQQLPGIHSPKKQWQNNGGQHD